LEYNISGQKFCIKDIIYLPIMDLKIDKNILMKQIIVSLVLVYVAHWMLSDRGLTLKESACFGLVAFVVSMILVAGWPEVWHIKENETIIETL
jgi:hypothetical protein